MSAAPIAYPLFIGTYARQTAAGVYRVTFAPSSGALSEPVRVAELERPSFICYSPDNRHLYALNQSDDTVVAFAVDHAIGTLKELNRQPTGFSGACFVITDATARLLIAISYGDAAVVSFAIEPDGRLGPRQSEFRHSGQPGPHPARQDKAHAHSATFSPDNRFVYVCDLGTDRIIGYRVESDFGRLHRAPEADGTSPAGAGPRHAKFTADGRFLYVVNELSGSISTFACDPGNGHLQLQQTVSTLRDDYRGENTSSEIRIHPNERFVYAANRGPDDLAVFGRDPNTGNLSHIQTIPTGGGHPRNFAVSPDGHWLVCANRDDNSLTVFELDPNTGRLTATAHHVALPEPVCVLFPFAETGA